MTGCDHEHSELIAEAARWLVQHRIELTGPVTAELRNRFGLGFSDAVEAMAEANRIDPDPRGGAN